MIGQNFVFQILFFPLYLFYEILMGFSFNVEFNFLLYLLSGRSIDCLDSQGSHSTVH